MSDHIPPGTKPTGTSDAKLAYYNENDPKAAAWLRELIKVGAIAPGQVDERDIRDVRPSELDGFTQCHFFAGIGVWSYALRLAKWSDNEPVWTGSCPCQPFSSAGRGGGFDDERHLWPAWFHLIEERRPAVIFGEQVASPDGLAWLDLVQTDLEATGHAVAPVDLCAAGFGAPHIRQRLYWVADDTEPGRQPRRRSSMASDGRETARFEPGRLCDAGELAESSSERFEGERLRLLAGRPLETLPEARRDGEIGALGITAGSGRPRIGSESTFLEPLQAGQSFWANCEWLPCRDGKIRPVEPGAFPLAHGAPARVGRLRGYGNAIVAHQAAEFIASYRELGI